MMTGVPLQQMADRVAGLMEERLRVRGQGLAEKLRKGGRLLPRKVRASAEVLATAAQMAQNPKLLMQVDQQQAAAAYDVCLRHLGKAARRGRADGLVSVVASIAVSVLVVALLVVGVLYWRGLL
jgi:hypothetical protein